MALYTTFKLAYSVSLFICMIIPNYGHVFDVTKYGAVADGKTDNANAFLNAWGAACAIGGAATFLIPRGNFYLGPVSFRGPCANNSSPRVELQGTMLSPKELEKIKTVGWVEFRSLNGLTIVGGGTLDGQGSESWKKTTCPGTKFCKNLPITLRLIKLTNASIDNLNLLNSKGFHMAIHMSDYVKVRNMKITAPQTSPNTDGCHVSGSRFVDIADVNVGTGDDCISIGPGTFNLSVSNVICGPGHGISIGSLGKYQNEKDVVGVQVRNCTISNTDNGLRVKTWPGSLRSVAKDLTFEDIVMNNVTMPINIDQRYCPSHHCGDTPSQVQISNVLFKNIHGTSSNAKGASIFCSKSMPCKNVHLEHINLKHMEAEHINLKHMKANVRARASEICSSILDNIFGNAKPNICQ